MLPGVVTPSIRPMYGNAIFGGPSGNYGPHKFRYLLWRCWDPYADQLTFILCNPSTAGGLTVDGLASDPTVGRLVEIANEEEAGGFVLVNLVAYIEPDLRRSRGMNLVTVKNEAFIEAVLGLGNKVVVGWGDRFKQERKRLLFSLRDRDLWCVGRNLASRTPMHPLQRGPKLLKLAPYPNPELQ